ncbi:hypothetical protein KXD93_04960 [Mucilaginibacter sp. BJC16-A38]|uniref:hypothetical protein n=1 Tax=Mucilaginibacter phenanthrenivorans TaxID=1234842 RepID=UPI002157FF8F|nr:hypothetical protein [Mucilaginibacter phenanthrenivorans]MCR8556977.1 hypothetical protein [Mucilaginibacter phenanthrenivorans]
MDQLEMIARRLKAEAGKYHPDLYAAHIVSLIHGVTHPWNAALLKQLASPLRQLLYLLNLNLTSPVQEQYEEEFSDREDWPKLVGMLNEMDTIHRHEYGELKPLVFEGELSPDELIRRRIVGIGTYIAFFHQGPLHYEEQGIEKVEAIFQQFNAELKQALGWDATDLIALYDHLDDLRQAREDRAMMKQNLPEPTEEEFRDRVMETLKNGGSFEEAMRSTMTGHMGMFQYVSNPSSVHTFTPEDLACFSPVVAALLPEHFAMERAEQAGFLYFSQPNQLIKRPILKLGKGSYLITDFRLLLSAMFSFLQEQCTAIIKTKDRVSKAKDKFLERKVTELFTDFYRSDPKAQIIPSYYIDGSERDLLVLSGKTALIIEDKAGKFREPLFDADKAYDKIWSDFKSTIDYGYEQAHSVRQKFLDGKPFDLLNEKKEIIATVDPAAYTEVYMIIVTYYKLGQAENDLWLMLDLFDDDVYPYATCVDDLENFLLAMQKLRFKPADFHRFLRIRGELHGDLRTNDEGRVTGQFLRHKRLVIKNGRYSFSADDDLIYDELYSTGLGFKKERRLAIKQDPRIRKLV